MRTIVPRVAAGLALELTGFAPAIGLLAIIIELNRPSNYVGGGFLAPMFSSIAAWSVLHVIGGALLLDALVKSRRILGLDPLGALDSGGLALYVMGIVSTMMAGNMAVVFGSYGAYVAAFYPWLSSMLAGAIMGIVACRNASRAAIDIGAPPPSVTALPVAYPGGIGVIASF